jgi:hypothetical protein
MCTWLHLIKHENRGTILAICKDEHGGFVGAYVPAIPRIFEPATMEAICCREAAEEL